MQRDTTPPMFMSSQLTWGVHDENIQDLTFSASATTFKYAIGVRPRARTDHAIAENLARSNWALLELIAREAQAEGGIAKTFNHNGWQINHTIDDSVFRRLLERHRSQLTVMRR